MSEEAENSGGGSLKSILIGLASTIALGVGGFVTKQLTGEGDEPAPQATTAAAPVINITQQQQQAAPSGGGKTVIIKEKESAPAAAPAPKKKTEKEALAEEPKW
jgi:hypothetical protein